MTTMETDRLVDECLSLGWRLNRHPNQLV